VSLLRMMYCFSRLSCHWESFSSASPLSISWVDWILLQLHLLMWIDAEKRKNRVRGRSWKRG
jgi:hypothetical protein